jgi:predicted TIM-barrel fold metal-dependent hydrolase
MPADIHTHPHRRSVKDTQGHYGNYDLAAEWLPDGSFKPGFVEEFLADMAEMDRVVVLAVAAPYWIAAENDFIAAFARACGDKVIGFASVDPNSPTAVGDVERAVLELGLRGVKLAPIYQNFEPDSPKVYPLYAKIRELGVPIIWHQGTSMAARFGPLEAAHPVRLDRVLRDFPEITMIFSHLCYPWAQDAVVMARKHPQLFVDISAMATRPWYVYNALVAAQEYEALDKILFASDYPWYTPSETRDALFALADMARGTSLPQLSPAVLEGIFNRDAERLLKLPARQAMASGQPQGEGG